MSICQAITKTTGKQCNRKIKKDDIYCYMHKPENNEVTNISNKNQDIVERSNIVNIVSDVNSINEVSNIHNDQKSKVGAVAISSNYEKINNLEEIKKVYSRNNNFISFEGKIIPYNMYKGTIYEIYINHYINTLQTTKISYLWKDIPETILYCCNIITEYNKHRLERKNEYINTNKKTNPLKDIGIDIIQVNIDGSFTFVQCKNYSNTIVIDHLSGFLAMMCEHAYTEGVVYHSENKISNNIKKIFHSDRIKFIHLPFDTNVQITEKIKNESTEEVNEKIMKTETENEIVEENKDKIIEEGKIQTVQQNVNVSRSELIEENIGENKSGLIEESKSGLTEENKSKVETSISSKFELYDYQRKIVEIYHNHYLTNEKSILSSPSGTGKTAVSCFIAKEYKTIIFITPRRQYAEQNIERFIEYEPDRKCLLIDCDGTRNIVEIKKFISDNDKIMLSTTYHSCDIIVQLFDHIKDVFIIVDEFHNLSANNIYGYQAKDIQECIENDNNDNEKFNNNLEEEEFDNNLEEEEFDDDSDEERLNDDSKEEKINENFKDYFDNKEKLNINCVDAKKLKFNDEKVNLSTTKKINPLNIIINSKYKKLYVSATPRVFVLENSNYDNEEIFGPILHNMSFDDAIENRYITDYNIYLPLLEDDSKDELNNVIDDIKDETKLNLNEIELCKKVCFLFEAIKQHGTLKSIIYFTNHNKIKKFINYLNLLNQYYCYDYTIDNISYRDSKEQRTLKLKKFRESEKITFICSVGILDECIDVPECNSIYITYNCKSKIKNIQRLCRAVRLDKNNMKKVAKIFLWCDEISDSLTYISSIKEYDLNYIKKIKFIAFNKELVKNGHQTNKIYLEKYSPIFVEIIEYKRKSWATVLEILRQFIITNKRKPHIKTDKYLYGWISSSNQFLATNNHIMKDENVRKIWKEFIDEYKEYIPMFKDEWHINLQKMEDFITLNKRKPSRKSIDQKEASLSIWIQRQKTIFKKNIEGMSQKDKREIWIKVTNKYMLFIGTNEEVWEHNLSLCKSFLNQYKHTPSKHLEKATSNEEYRLGIWISNQFSDYRKNEGMVIKKYKDIFKKFVEDYKTEFQGYSDI